MTADALPLPALRHLRPDPSRLLSWYIQRSSSPDLAWLSSIHEFRAPARLESLMATVDLGV